MKLSVTLPLIASFFFTVACTTPQQKEENLSKEQESTAHLQGLKKAYFASGCFWCVEAVFESVKGVEETISGYAGGDVKKPTYELVSSGKTKHAESVEVYYDPEIVSYHTLLVVFFGSQDPTTVNQQGPDRGPQYRSIVFYQNPEEEKMARDYIRELNASGQFRGPVVTEVLPFKAFYKAEDYHQNYEKNHPDNSYVRNVSIPRLHKFQEKFPELLK